MLKNSNIQQNSPKNNQDAGIHIYFLYSWICFVCIIYCSHLSVKTPEFATLAELSINYSSSFKTSLLGRNKNKQRTSFCCRLVRPHSVGVIRQSSSRNETRCKIKAGGRKLGRG